MSNDSIQHCDIYDLIVLGSGPAGTHAAVQAAKLNKKVAMVEKNPERIGGAWIHTGTLPSKTLRESLATIQSIGFHVGKNWVNRIVSELSISQLLGRANKVSMKEESIICAYLERNDVSVIKGYGFIEDEQCVRVNLGTGESKLIKAEKILIATGSRPRRPMNIPFDGWRIVCSDQILRLKSRPRSMTIFGAGVIGCEYACIFSAMGIKLTVLDARTHLMRFVDREISEELRLFMEEQGVTFKLGDDIKTVVGTESEAIVELKNGDIIKSDVFFYAGGRTSNTDRIGLENVGIKVDDRSAIIVNEHFQTTVPNIYAAGDAIGPPALAATSAEQGRHACLHAFGKTKKSFPKIFPIGIYTIPEVSSVGRTEEELKADNIPYVVGSAELEEVARGQIRGDSHGILKILVCQSTHKLLGIHIVGADACNLVHIGLALMISEQPVQHLVNEMIFNYPTLAEAYRVAAFNCLNKIFPDGNFEDPPVENQIHKVA